jgi:SHS2 domain-containing protein
LHEILQHTADVRLRIVAPTLDALFAEAVDALMEVMKPLSRSVSTTEEAISMDADDLTSLLVDFLGEILLRCHIRRQAYTVAKISLAESSLTATLHARRVEQFEEDVKAVTYHEADVRKGSEGWETTLVLDV